MSTAAATFTGLPEARIAAVRDLGLRLLGEVLFWLVVVQLVTGLYLQSQLAVFNGRIAIPNGVPKLGLVTAIMGMAAFVLLRAKGRIALRPSMMPACIFACYVVADLGWLLMTSNLPVGAILIGFNKYFLFFTAIPAAALLRPHLSAQQMTARLVLLFIPLMLLAIAQYGLNDPVVLLVSEDGSYEVPSVDFYGQLRAFSLFRGVLECGQGMAFFGAMLLAQIHLGRRRDLLWRIPLLLLTAVACYVTFRRGAYMEFGATAISSIAISRRMPLARWLPWCFLLVGIALASSGTLLQAAKGDGVMSSESLGERHKAWNMVLDRWLLREDESLLFGTGLAQIESDQVEYFLVDNGFLAVGARLGLVGLALWCWVMHSLWKDMLATAWRTRSVLAIAVAALLSTWMMRDVFDPLFAVYPLYVFLVFWSEGADSATSSAGQRREVAPCA